MAGTEAIPLPRNPKIREEIEDAMRSSRKEPEPIELDFTTPGAVGDLSCPFATKAARRRSHGATSSHRRPDSLPTPPEIKDHVFDDPIAAEFHAGEFSSPPASINETSAKCPIRYLDDHSPEEVAQYFENHKHEIPRSHAVCVKRYQSNEESIRQLDAKYGNLVNMIQGLGMKHQPMLNTGEEKDSAMMDTRSLDRKSMEKVEKWAQTCTDGDIPTNSENITPEADTETRSSHFDRPLEEVRLGESPTRPWGIKVPFSEQAAMSAEPQEAESNAARSMASAKLQPPSLSGVSRPRKPPGKCPFGHDGGGGVSSAHTTNVHVHEDETVPGDIQAASVEAVVDAPIAGPEPKKCAGHPRVVFSGPVFFGYSAEQAAALLNGLQGSRG